MYELSIKAEFSSAHNLRGYQGKCESLHGHNWQVEVVVSSDELNKIGIAVDFKNLKKIVNEITKSLDHKYLNKLPYFRKLNPTSENIAKFIFTKAKPLFKNELAFLKSVSVWENEHSKATYYE